MEKQLSCGSTVEGRTELAAAMAGHALARLECASWQPSLARPGLELEARSFTAGAFTVQHTRALHGQWQVLDVWSGRKVLSLRHDGNGWTLVSMKRGDWESAFLLT